MKARTSIPLVVRPTRLFLILDKIAKLFGFPGFGKSFPEITRRDMPTDRNYVEITSDEGKDKDDKEDDDAKNDMP